MKAISSSNYAKDHYYPKVSRAASELLEEYGVVAPVEVFIKLGLLSKEGLEDWRFGRVPFLEKVIRCNLEKASRILRILAHCARELKLKPSRTAYMRWGKGPRYLLRFTKKDDPNLEAAYSRHFVRLAPPWSPKTARPASGSREA